MTEEEYMAELMMAQMKIGKHIFGIIDDLERNDSVNGIVTTIGLNGHQHKLTIEKVGNQHEQFNLTR